MEWLRQAIERAGGVAAVCSASDLTPGHVYNILRGERPLALETVKRLRVVLDDVSDEQWAAGMLAPCGTHSAQTRPPDAERAGDAA
ncbi:MAG: hypothetical protein H6697_10020 [Myxococcales bacterium]|nr:hypothetical protein [Myxococcales bacterium]